MSLVAIFIEHAVYALPAEISVLASSASSWRAKAISSRPSSTMAMLEGEPMSLAFRRAASSAWRACS
jgi:hypothetical protein